MYFNSPIKRGKEELLCMTNDILEMVFATEGETEICVALVNVSDVIKKSQFHVECLPFETEMPEEEKVKLMRNAISMACAEWNLDIVENISDVPFAHVIVKLGRTDGWESLRRAKTCEHV